MTVLVRVQHHPSRVELLDRLLPRLDGLDVEVVTDPDADSPIRSPWRCYVECLRRPLSHDHLVIVQDDALPCRRLSDALPVALTAHPDRIIALYVGGTPVRTARDVKAAYRDGRPFVQIHRADFLPTVAVAYPADAVAHFLRWVTPRRVASTQRGDDGPAGKFMRETGRGALATVPSLVQHPDDVPSTIRRRHGHGANAQRVAAVWREDPDEWLALTTSSLV